MRIISNFKDFYDCSQKFGQDQELLYRRYTQELEVRRKDQGGYETGHPGAHPSSDAERYAGQIHGNWDRAYLGFCGKVYPGITWKESYSTVGNGWASRRVFGFSARVVKDSFEPEELTRKGYVGMTTVEQKIDLLFRSSPAIDDRLFARLKCPVWIKYYDWDNEDRDLRAFVIKDPCLSDTGFMSIVDPITAYQEISMYLGGVLGNPEPQMVQIADKDQLVKKGFDDMSFKTYSPGKKTKRRNK